MFHQESSVLSCSIGHVFRQGRTGRICKEALNCFSKGYQEFARGPGCRVPRWKLKHEMGIKWRGRLTLKHQWQCKQGNGLTSLFISFSFFGSLEILACITMFCQYQVKLGIETKESVRRCMCSFCRIFAVVRVQTNLFELNRNWILATSWIQCRCRKTNLF
jgi:hypothetical protein